MPSFLDFVFAFKERTTASFYAIFRKENYLDQVRGIPGLCLPDRLRSGLLIQHAFNLIQVERTNIPNEHNKWPLRQAALYHCFDIVTGQALFAVLKGNTAIANRVKDEVNNHRDLQSSRLGTLEGSFIGTLQVQLIVLEWCGQNWAEYVDEFEEEARNKTLEVKYAPVSIGISPANVDMNFPRRSKLSQPAPMTGTFTGRSTLASIGSSAGSAARLGSGSQQPVHANTATATLAQGRSTNSVSQTRRGPGLRQSVAELFRRVSGTPHKRSLSINTELTAVQAGDQQNILLELDDMLSFEELQRLNRWCDEIEQCLMAIAQNKEVLEQVKRQYSEIIESNSEFRQNIKGKRISTVVNLFFQRIDNVIRDLDIHFNRLKAMSLTLENNKALYGAALQYQSAKVSEHFAHSARESSERMEDMTVKMHRIAIKTEHQTVSMHVITVFTLIFLPGTFIATFFSSGVIQFNEDGSHESDYFVLPDALALFWYVTIPILVVVLGVWALVYWVARRKRLSKSADDIVTASDDRYATSLM
ncbi:hypothetical protein GGR57DRAFT_403673 [Xylariaceae sp. FL1272]|nr:hypothetical protein GGR57DRAFT_403673 [Xylariaceae sp. FL1272]